MKSIGTKELRTERLILRKMRNSDAEDLHRAGVMGETTEEAREIVERIMQYNDDPMTFHWVLEYQGAAVGRIKAWEVNPRDDYAQLGYDIGAAYRSMGLMTEAVKAVVKYLVQEAEMNRVYCLVRESNLPSIRVCEKAGMQREGKMRKHFKEPDGSYVDVAVFGILRSEI